MSFALEKVEDRLRQLLIDVLGVAPSIAAQMDAETPLFGALPELDSMAVASLLTELEDQFEIIVDDEDVDGALFETFGTLTAFVKAKVAE